MSGESNKPPGESSPPVSEGGVPTPGEDQSAPEQAPQQAPPQQWQQQPQQAPPQQWQQQPQQWPQHQQAWPQQGYQPAGPPPDPNWLKVMSSGVATAAKLHLVRTFSTVTRSDLILDSEKRALESATPPVKDPRFQGFMAWRRSVMTVAAVLLIPIFIGEVVDLFSYFGDLPSGGLKFISILLLAVTGLFVALVWMVRLNWVSWDSSRRNLLTAWLIYFLAPFVVFLLPLREMVPANMRADVGIVFALNSIIVLLPRALSLMPGLIRASVTTKMVFPGAAAPGWLLLLATPIYALLVYVVLTVPYQASGDPLVLMAILGFMAAPAYLGVVGYRLVHPLREDASISLIKRARVVYLVCNAIGFLFLLIAVGGWLSELPDFNWWTVISAGLSLLTNVLLLGLIGTDLVVLGLNRARELGKTQTAEMLRQSHERSLRHFVDGKTTGTLPRPAGAQPVPVQPPTDETPTDEPPTDAPPTDG